MALWKKLHPLPEPGIEGSLPFRFENFGTFGGPQHSSTNYDYDKASQEGIWTTLLAGDYAFKNADLGVYLYNNELNYVGFHCDGVSTAQMYLSHCAKSSIPIFTVRADVTNVCGKTINTTGNIHAAGNITANGKFIFNGPMFVKDVGDVASRINQNTVIANGKKGFDIPHPSKDGHRLRYICLEGPDAEVYLRGKLKGDNIIELPHVWRDLVDLESIGVTLTPIGCYQELFVEKIQWGTQITVKNNLSGPINCSYVVYGTRKDTQRNIPEYEGLTIDDYPGDNREYNINGL
tara:strand:+ start:582 stop:1454 length:873 start_codon:yes stop_codon:yes gene_type:complete